LFHATPLGQLAIDGYLESQRQAWAVMEADVLALLLRGDVQLAARRIAEHEAHQVFSSGPGIDWSLGMPTAYLEQATYLINHSYEDLPLEENRRRVVGAHLALCVLLGLPYSTASKRLVSLTSGAFSCPLLADFLQGDKHGSHAGDFVGDSSPEGLAYLYAH